MITLFDLLKNTVSEHSENIAIEFEEHTITYSKLQIVINKLANGLLNLGIKKGDRVVILLPNVPHIIFAYYAILRIGGIIVPINPFFEASKIQYIFQETQPSAILIWEGFYNRIINLINDCKNIIILGNKTHSQGKLLTDIIATATNDEPEVEINLEDTAQIQYTPGISNSPKGIELTHQNLITVILSCIKMFLNNSTDVYGGLLPLFLLYSQNMIMNSALLQGAKLILYPKLSMKTLAQAIFEDKITTIIGSPNMFQMLLENKSDNYSTNTLKYAFSFGSSCSEELLTDFEKRFGVPILEGYGITEASALISYNRNEKDRKKGSVGLPIDGIEIKIVDDNDVELKPREIGQIIIYGKNIMKGYWNQPSQENELIKNGWLYTGDLGKIDHDGYLYFIERKEDVIVKAGFHIYPSEVENLLIKHPKIDQISIVGVPHPVHKQEVKACVVLKKEQQATPEEIIEFCIEQMPVYKCPQIIQFYDSLPKSATGKILKRKLRNNI